MTIHIENLSVWTTARWQMASNVRTPAGGARTNPMPHGNPHGQSVHAGERRMEDGSQREDTHSPWRRDGRCDPQGDLPPAIETSFGGSCVRAPAPAAESSF